MTSYKIQLYLRPWRSRCTDFERMPNHALPDAALSRCQCMMLPVHGCAPGPQRQHMQITSARLPCNGRSSMEPYAALFHAVEQSCGSLSTARDNLSRTRHHASPACPTTIPHSTTPYACVIGLPKDCLSSAQLRCSMAPHPVLATPGQEQPQHSRWQATSTLDGVAASHA